MKNGIFKKTPSLSFQLRVPRAKQARKPTSNKLECHSSLFELIRVSEGREGLRPSNELESTRISSNKFERREDEPNG